MPIKKKPNFSTEDIALKGIDYVSKKATIKELETQCKECRKPLEDFINTNGKTLESGSILAVVPYADKDVHLKKTLRVSNVLLPEAMDVIRENGLEECIENVPTIREDVLERMYNEGKVTKEVMTQLYAQKNTYAFSVELKERLADAPE